MPITIEDYIIYRSPCQSRRIGRGFFALVGRITFSEWPEILEVRRKTGRGFSLTVFRKTKPTSLRDGGLVLARTDELTIKEKWSVGETCMKIDGRGWIDLLCDGVVQHKVRFCCSCGNLVNKWGGTFRVGERSYKLCPGCFAEAMAHYTRGTLVGFMSYQGWDLNYEKQKAIRAALLAHNLKEMY